MNIRLRNSLGKAMGGAKVFKPFGISEDSWNWRREAEGWFELNIDALSPAKLDMLEKLFESHKEKQGVGVLLSDIALWRKAQAGGGDVKARTVKQFRDLLVNYLLPLPRHWLFKKESDGVWLPYFVQNIEYHPPKSNSYGSNPAYVEMDMVYEKFGGKDHKSILFYQEHLTGKTVAQALAAKDLFPENEEHLARYSDEMALFAERTAQVGTQFYAVGIAYDDPDGNPEGRRDSWYWKRTNAVTMDRDGEPSRVVMDIFFEEEKDAERQKHVDTYFWTRAASRIFTEDEDELAEIEDIQANDFTLSMPVHPWVVVFHLAKHLRVRIHVTLITPYAYDTALADKLVLSAERKALVRLLIEAKDAGFRDIVKGKGGGAVVLLAGPPGTGKTLTAEVYAEAEQRALYSIQCSQLGTDPDTLEDELLKVFARAKRWNAVVLLDEADVYVHQRGVDLTQNAIVGVFLRVLEYQSSVLFLTTNRPDDVDDAIASRCIARLSYEIPSLEDQKAIWRVLASASGTALTEANLLQIAAENPHLSGRDVKNLLKLARLVGSDGVTPETVEFVRQFQPTINVQAGATKEVV